MKLSLAILSPHYASIGKISRLRATIKINSWRKDFLTKKLFFQKKQYVYTPINEFLTDSKQHAYRRNFYFPLKSSLDPIFVFIYPITN